MFSQHENAIRWSNTILLYIYYTIHMCVCVHYIYTICALFFHCFRVESNLIIIIHSNETSSSSVQEHATMTLRQSSNAGLLILFLSNREDKNLTFRAEQNSARLFSGAEWLLVRSETKTRWFEYAADQLAVFAPVFSRLCSETILRCTTVVCGRVSVFAPFCNRSVVFKECYILVLWLVNQCRPLLCNWSRILINVGRFYNHLLRNPVCFRTVWTKRNFEPLKYTERLWACL